MLQRGERTMILYYVLGAAIGALVGYFVLYRSIGCSTGTCPLTANPYISTGYGLILGVLLVSVIVSPANPARSNDTHPASVIGYKRITAQEAKANIDSDPAIIILDVRTESEFEAGHIPGAILVPNQTITTDQMPPLLPDLDAQIYVYCRSGNRSAQAAKKLIDIGYKNVYDFGGINDWPYDIVTQP